MHDSFDAQRGWSRIVLISNLRVYEIRERRKVLYLIGENLDSDRAHYLVKTGRIVQLMRGIYADAAEDGPAL